MSESEKLVVRRYLDRHGQDKAKAFDAWRGAENYYAFVSALGAAVVGALVHLAMFNSITGAAMLCLAIFILAHNPVTPAREEHMAGLFNKA